MPEPVRPGPAEQLAGHQARHQRAAGQRAGGPEPGGIRGSSRAVHSPSAVTAWTWPPTATAAAAAPSRIRAAPTLRLPRRPRSIRPRPGRDRGRRRASAPRRPRQGSPAHPPGPHRSPATRGIRRRAIGQAAAERDGRGARQQAPIVRGEAAEFLGDVYGPSSENLGAGSAESGSLNLKNRRARRGQRERRRTPDLARSWMIARRKHRPPARRRARYRAGYRIC